MLGKISRRDVAHHFNRAKNFLGNAYHHTRSFLGDVDHGVRTFNKSTEQLLQYLKVME